MKPLARGAVIRLRRQAHLGAHAVGDFVLVAAGHAVVGAVEAQVGDAVVTLHARGFLEAGGEVGAYFAEDGDLAFDDFFFAAGGHVAGDVADEAFFGVFIEDFLPKIAGGVEVFGTDLGEEGYGVGGEFAVDFVEIDGTLAELDRLDGGEVVRAGTLVVESHVAVPLEVGYTVFGSCRVDRKLLVIDPDTVTMGVRVGEKTRLQDWIGRRLDTGYHMGWIKSNLLDFSKIILGVLVELEAAYFAKGKLFVGPDMGQVEGVDLLLLPQFFGLLGSHRLEGYSPRGEFSTLDGLEQILLGVIGRLGGGIFLCDELGALV